MSEIKIKSTDSDKSSNKLNNLLLDCVDDLNGQLMEYFEGMFKNGRDFKLIAINLGTSSLIESFNDLFNEFMTQNDLKDKFEILTTSNKQNVYKVTLSISKTLKNGKEVSYDNESFSKDLNKYFKTNSDKLKLKIISTTRNEVIIEIE